MWRAGELPRHLARRHTRLSLSNLNSPLFLVFSAPRPLSVLSASRIPWFSTTSSATSLSWAQSSRAARLFSVNTFSHIPPKGVRLLSSHTVVGTRSFSTGSDASKAATASGVRQAEAASAGKQPGGQPGGKYEAPFSPKRQMDLKAGPYTRGKIFSSPREDPKEFILSCLVVFVMLYTLYNLPRGEFLWERRQRLIRERLLKEYGLTEADLDEIGGVEAPLSDDLPAADAVSAEKN